MVDVSFRHSLERLPRGRKGPNKLFERFRRVGKLKNAPLKVSEASEGSNRLFEGFRGVGRRQGRRPSLPGYQENFAGGRSRPEASESPATRFEPPEGSEGAKITSNIPVT